LEVIRMLRRSALALLFAFFGAESALSCGPGTVALIERVIAMQEPPKYRCGAEFNEMLARAHKKDWKGALAAYETHLTNLGKSEVGSANALETLAYLRHPLGSRRHESCVYEGRVVVGGLGIVLWIVGFAFSCTPLSRSSSCS
jgi:hypothetical protein